MKIPYIFASFQKLFLLLSKALDFLMPRNESEGHLLLLSDGEILSLLPRYDETRDRPLPEGIYSAFAYRNKNTEALVRLLKYQNNEKVRRVAGNALSEMLLSYLEEKFFFHGDKSILIVPIPMSVKEKRRRGWNQAEELAKGLCEKEELKDFFEYAPILEKVRETKRQTEMKSKKEREENLRGVFALSIGVKIKGKTIFLIDDVTTTGTTLQEARRTLKASGAKEVLCFTLAC
ncbi:MAG: phosphoribosyltransferase family protein [Patescibacteria group bacterium]